MMTVLYIEPFSGLSGDMLLSAFCGLADYYEEIVRLPQKLNLPDGKIVVDIVNKNGIVCKHVRPIDLNESSPDIHSKSKTHHHAAHRHLKDIINIIEAGDIPATAKSIAKEIFTIIGQSEAKIHQVALNKIHFHEISAVDSILDIVGCAVLIDRLKVGKTFSAPICTGYGMVQTQHGLLPVPAPATADLLLHMPTYPGGEEGERVTPTGAAILKYLVPEFTVPQMKKEKIAYGPGSKDFIGPNVVRVSMLKSETKSDRNQQYIMLDTNLDDMSFELLGIDFQNGLMANGAVDFYFTSVQMKKGRPGVMLSVLLGLNDLERISSFILEHTSSIGVRSYAVDRTILSRKQTKLNTPFGPVWVKQVQTPSGGIRNKIEYESLLKLKEEHGMSIPTLKAKLYGLLNEYTEEE